MGGLFGGGGGSSSPAPAPPQVVYMPSVPEYIPAPTDTTQEVKDAAEKQRKAGIFAKGRRSTLLTGGEGVTDTATVQRKSLLGE